jgi:hypothetical protein
MSESGQGRAAARHEAVVSRRSPPAPGLCSVLTEETSCVDADLPDRSMWTS